jgi:hypothetical protein
MMMTQRPDGARLGEASPITLDDSPMTPARAGTPYEAAKLAAVTSRQDAPMTLNTALCAEPGPLPISPPL